MKSASVKELKTTLENATSNELIEYCLQLIKFKKENKELLTYLIYDQNDTNQYAKNVQEYLNTLFEDVNIKQLYFAKKTIRKIIMLANKYIKYSKNAIVEIDIHLFVTEKIKALKLPLEQNKALLNIYNNQIKKINKTLINLHEDEQYDYLKRIRIL